MAPYVLEGTRWRKIHGNEVANLSHAASSIVWTGTNQAVVTYRDYDVLLYNDGSITGPQPITRDALLNVKVESIARQPTFGIYFGGDNGRLYGYEPEVDDYRQVSEVSFFGAMEGLLAHGDGFILGGTGGRLAQYCPGKARCTVAFGAGADASELARVGPDVLVSGGNIDRRRPNNVTWLFPR